MNLTGVTIWSSFGGYMVHPVNVTFTDYVSADDFVPVEVTCIPGSCQLDALYGSEIANSTTWTFSDMTAAKVDTNWLHWNPDYLSCGQTSCTIAFADSVYFDTYSQTDSFTLSFTPAIPEPAAWLTLLVGALCLIALAKRRV